MITGWLIELAETLILYLGAVSVPTICLPRFNHKYQEFRYPEPA